jgi:recombination protein RecA
VRSPVAQIAILARLRAEQARLTARTQLAAPPGAFQLEALAGRLCELSSEGPSAALTLAFSLVARAQAAGEPVAWIGGRQASFYPPDVSALGVALASLAVIRVPDEQAIGRAAAELVRSGAFGLCVLDLTAGGARASLAMPLQTRLLGLAQKHDAAILCLTEKPRDAPSLGSLISLRAEAVRTRAQAGGFLCTLRVLKDKRAAPGWYHEEVRRGPAGLR